MIKLNQHELDFEYVIKYFYYSLVDTNILSSTLIKLVDFKAGRFFTILPSDADLTRINEFRCGGIAGGVRDQVSSIILNKMHLNDKLACIFDDITSAFRLNYQDPLFLSCGLVYEREIYYLVRQKTASIQLINQCFHASNAVWHSLCILTGTNFKNEDAKELSLEKIKEICLNTDLIIIGAYDGEGYVFWEKNKTFS